MRILALTLEAFGGNGGIAQFNRDLLTAMSAHPECTEVVAVVRRTPNPLEPLPGKLRYVAGHFGTSLEYVAAVVKAVYRNPRLDVILCSHLNLLPIAILLRQWVHAPVLLVIYGIDAWRPTRSWLTNHLIGHIDALVSISQVTIQRFLQWARVDGAMTFILPNAIDLTRYRPGPRNAALVQRYGLAGMTVLMTLGRLVSAERRKGFDEVLELLPKLLQEFPALSYIIVGDGQDRRRLEEKAKTIGVQDHVVFAGAVPEAEKVDYYRLADAYVMPSQGEGFGFVFLEAMACGIPVVASKTDGSREAVRDGALGALVDPTDPDDIRRGILEALGRPRGAIPEGLDHFSYERFEQRCHGILDQLLARRPHASRIS